jgi:peptide/nickel transport system ATP-binding protein
VDQIVNRPRHPYTCGLMGSIPPVDQDVLWLQQIDGAMPRLSARPTGCPFHPRCKHATEQCVSTRPLPHPEGVALVACWHPQQGMAVAGVEGVAA